MTAHAQQESAGIPINDPTVISKCGGCHTRSDNGVMIRISAVRTTPEIWEQIVKRMIRLNGLTITPDEARQVVRYLSDNNGLAPAEAKPAFYDAEHRVFGTQEEEAGIPAQLQRTCNYCHTIGRVFLQRRTPEDYVKLANTHMALFPGSESAVFKPNRRYPNPVDIPVALTQAGTGYGVLAISLPTAAHRPRVLTNTRSTLRWNTWRRVSLSSLRNGLRGKPRCTRRSWLVSGW